MKTTKLQREHPELEEAITTLYAAGETQVELSRMFNVRRWVIQDHFSTMNYWDKLKANLYPVADMRGHGKTEPYYYNEMEYGSDGKINGFLIKF